MHPSSSVCLISEERASISMLPVFASTATDLTDEEPKPSIWAAFSML